MSLPKNKKSRTPTPHCPTCQCGAHPEMKRNPVEPLPIDHGFDVFWEIYPRRYGIAPKGHKEKTRAKWCTLTLEERRLAYRATRVLVALVETGEVLPKDAERFLAQGHSYWADLADTQPAAQKTSVVRVVA